MLSIVMPVYNTRPEQLERSVRSLLDQTYKKLEILLVDDGSGEESREKLKELAAQDSRIRLIRQDNAGASAARNTGILAARGRYLAMMDSDDEIVNNAYEKVIRNIELSGADVGVFGFREVSGDGGENNHPAVRGKKRAVTTPDRILPALMLSASAYGGGYPWNKVWDLSRIGKAELFEEGLSCYEDKLWCAQMYRRCRKILLLPEIYYTYYETANSLSRKSEGNREEAIRKRRSALKAYQRMREIFPKTAAAYWAAELFRMKTIIMGVLKRTL